MAHNEAHNALVRDALHELAIQGYCCWKNETGCWFDYTVVNGKLKKGRPHPYGKIGSGDIMGILPPTGRHMEFEAKTGTGRQGENQEGHQEFAVERNGGIYILFRSVPELMEKLRAAHA
jgi:hypothetical protein